MSLYIPTQDGEVHQYNLSKSGSNAPRIYYVNGIRVAGRDHALVAAMLSLLVERPIQGVHNKTNGGIVDLGQCLLDYTQNATARMGANRSLVPDQNINPSDIPKVVDDVIKKSLVWNKATAALFRQIALNISRPQMIIAHSQGNLVTSNALFIVERVLGSRYLGNVRVYSLASPSPAWPLGIRKTLGGGGRQDNAFMNDLVALLRPHNLLAKVGVDRFQNEGDFRTMEGAGAVGIAPHDTGKNVALNFLKSIRGDLGLQKELSPEFIERAQAIGDEYFQNDPTWKAWSEDLLK